MAHIGNNSQSLLLPKLTGKNYYHWSIQMRVLFQSQNLWDVVEKEIEEPEDEDDVSDEEIKQIKAVKKKDKKALYLIYQAVDETIFERISLAKSSKEAWDMLYTTYRGEDRVKIVRLQTLRCEFDGMKMKVGESVEEFHNRVTILVNQMRINGEIIEDRRIIEKILRSLTRKFEYVVVAIEESKDISTLSLESLLGILQFHEYRMGLFDDDPSSEQAYGVSTKAKGKDYEKSLSETQFFYCHKFGHMMKYCKKHKEDEREDANFVAGKENQKSDTMFMMVEELDDLVDDAWCNDDDDVLVKGNKEMCVPVDHNCHGKVNKFDDDG